MKKVFTIALVLMITLSARSQKKEYLVKNNGDTVYGSIAMRNNAFYITGTGNERTMLAADEVKNIRSNNFRGNTVVHLKLYLYTDNLLDLESGWANLKEADTTLVLTPIYSSPKMNLYRGTDNMRTQYYFYKQPADSIPRQLVVRYSIGGGATAFINVPWPLGDNSRAHLNKHKGYVNQLRYIIGDCKLISEKMWEELDYRDYSLKEVVKLYNQCN